MGTRAIVRFFDESSKPVACVYFQMDGYPNGRGLELARFLAGCEIVNGLNGEPPKEGKLFKANGMGCLAAQFIANVKNRAGSVYMMPVDESDDGLCFSYEVRPTEAVCRCVVGVAPEVRYQGPWSGFLEFCESDR